MLALGMRNVRNLKKGVLPAKQFSNHPFDAALMIVY